MIELTFLMVLVLNIHGVDYRCIMNKISKSETVQQNADLSNNSGTL